MTFGPLGQLHSFLDETANDRRFPPASHWKWEWIVRRGTADANHHVYEVTDFVCHRLAAQGLRPFVLMGQPPERRLPHPRLRGCGRVAILVAKNSIGVRQKRVMADYLVRVGNSDWVHPWPRLSYAPPPLQFTVHEPKPGRKVLQNTRRHRPPSVAGVIRKLLAPRRRQRRTVTPIYLLTPEDLMLELCRWFARQSPSWVGLCTVVDALRDHADSLDWRAFWVQAERAGALYQVVATLLCTCELGGLRLPREAVEPALRRQLGATLSLFPIRRIAATRPVELEHAVSSLQHFLALPAFEDRRRFLSGLIKEQYARRGVIGMLLHSVASAVRLAWMSMWTGRNASSVPQVYWLEGPYRAAGQPEDDQGHSHPAAEHGLCVIEDLSSAKERSALRRGG